ncbi:hypothetical protein LFUMFP_200001 [Latilactobacillus fuchuensis]|uniref:Uncharacterized protein n=2 Tax=Latilactobacillus fuchuensis TaxID=164393 RepID=A0A2N9DUI8_9LACO|nr:hypothetical protein LFUMFP_200001 [Latilactobacillus fuchuensis]
MFIFLRKDKKGVGRIFLPTPESIDPNNPPKRVVPVLFCEKKFKNGHFLEAQHLGLECNMVN